MYQTVPHYATGATCRSGWSHVDAVPKGLGTTAIVQSEEVGTPLSVRSLVLVRIGSRSYASRLEAQYMRCWSPIQLAQCMRNCRLRGLEIIGP